MDWMQPGQTDNWGGRGVLVQCCSLWAPAAIARLNWELLHLTGTHWLFFFLLFVPMLCRCILYILLLGYITYGLLFCGMHLPLIIKSWLHDCYVMWRLWSLHIMNARWFRYRSSLVSTWWEVSSPFNKSLYVTHSSFALDVRHSSRTSTGSTRMCLTRPHSPLRHSS